MADKASLPDGDHEVWLGAFGESWFETLCTAAGIEYNTSKTDMRSTDAMLEIPCIGEVCRIQVKTTRHPKYSQGHLKYPLDVVAYNRLRVGAATGFLVVIVVHKDYPDWTLHFPGASLVRATGYLLRIAGMNATTNRLNVTVSLPLDKIVTPQTLISLLVEGGET